MPKFPSLSIEYIQQRLIVDVGNGKAFWKDATKHHRNLVGEEAGCKRQGHQGKWYWIIKIDGIPYRRAQIVLTVATGIWPVNMVDHKNGDSLDDRGENLRHATGTQNAWNHKGRKRQSNLPMGIRQLPSGKYQARLAVNKRMNNLGTFQLIDEAVAVYKAARLQHFGEFA